MMFRSIKVKVLVLQTGLILAIALAIGITTYLLMLTTMKQTQQQHLQYSAEHISENLNSLIKYKKQLLEKIATSEVVSSYCKKRNENLLIEYFKKFKSQFPVLAYVNEDGMEEFKLVNGKESKNLFSIMDSAMFTEATWHNNTTISSYHESCTEPNGPYVHFSYCYRDYFDEFVGLIVGKVPIADFAGIIHEFRFGRSGFAVLINDEGIVLSCRDKSLLLTKIVIDGVNADRIISGIKALESSTGRARILGIDGYYAFTPVHGQNWLVLTILPYKEFIAAPNRMGIITILISLVVLIIGVLASLVMATNIARPIYNITNVAKMVGKGDFSKRVIIKSKDEIGHLGGVFNYMTHQLRKTTTSIDSLNAANARLQESREQLELTNKQLVNSNQQLQEFINIASHDLREPIRKITAFGQLLKDALSGKLDDDMLENLDFVVDGALKMKQMVDSLLAYSKIITKDAEFEGVDLNKTIDHLRNYELSSVLRETSGSLLIQGPLPFVECDSVQVRQVLFNLIGNALKYHKQGVQPEVIVRAHRLDADMVRIEVRDNGIGIKPQYYNNIFAIFRRLHSNMEYEGIGVGLAICKRIIEKHGGEIGVESNYGEGTTFWFTLPERTNTKKEPKELISNTGNTQGSGYS